MAQRLIAGGVPTTLWARRDASLEAFRNTGARFAPTPAALGAASDVVCVCVVDDAGVEDVLLGVDGLLSGMQPGSIVAIHSTISLVTCHAAADAAAAHGVGVIDAPVSGGGVAASRGELTVMVGGTTELVDRTRPILETFGSNVFHLGPLGCGLIAKLVNNILHTAHYALAHDAVTAGEALGLNGAALGRALSVGSGNSFSLSTYVGMGGLERLAPHVGPLLRKDVAIFDALTQEHGAPTGALIAVADEALAHFGYRRDQ